MPKAKWWEREDSCFGSYYELEVPNSMMNIAVTCLDGVWHWSVCDQEDALGSGSADKLAEAKRACVGAVKRYCEEMLECLKGVCDGEG